MTKKIQALIVILGLAGILPVAHLWQTRQINQAPVQTTIGAATLSFENEITKALHQKEQKLWQALSVVGIDKPKVSSGNCMCRCTKKHTVRQTNNSSLLTAEAKTINLVKRVQQELGMADRNIAVYETSANTIAYSLPDMIVINKKLMAKYLQEAQEFIIGHELIHIQHEDSKICGIIDQQSKQSNNKKARDLYNKFGRFTEWRADVLTCNKSKRLLNGYKQFCAAHGHSKWAAPGHISDYDRNIVASDYGNLHELPKIRSLIA